MSHKAAIIFNSQHAPVDGRGEHLNAVFMCDLLHDGVGSETPQHRTVRWLVNVEGSSQI
jgi:hypothetical protein